MPGIKKMNSTVASSMLSGPRSKAAAGAAATATATARQFPCDVVGCEKAAVSQCQKHEFSRRLCENHPCDICISTKAGIEKAREQFWIDVSKNRFGALSVPLVLAFALFSWMWGNALLDNVPGFQDDLIGGDPSNVHRTYLGVIFLLFNYGVAVSVLRYFETLFAIELLAKYNYGAEQEDNN